MIRCFPAFANLLFLASCLENGGRILQFTFVLFLFPSGLHHPGAGSSPFQCSPCVCDQLFPLRHLFPRSAFAAPCSSSASVIVRVDQNPEARLDHPLHLFDKFEHGAIECLRLWDVANMSCIAKDYNSHITSGTSAMLRMTLEIS